MVAVQTRIARYVRLYAAGLAPVVVFSDGEYRLNCPSSGMQMALYAISIGLPEQAAIVQDFAQSTLQNALFSLPLVPDGQRFFIVTEAFHLPRS